MRMYTQANGCTAEPPLWLRSMAWVSSACPRYPAATLGHLHGQRHWGGRLARAGLGLTTCSMQKKKGNSGTGTDCLEPFLVLIRKCGTLGAAAALQGWVKSSFDHSKLSEVQGGAPGELLPLLLCRTLSWPRPRDGDTG